MKVRLIISLTLVSVFAFSLANGEEKRSLADRVIDGAINHYTPDSDSSTRKVQREAVKFAVDPRPAHSERHFEKMKEALVQSSSQSSTQEEQKRSSRPVVVAQSMNSNNASELSSQTIAAAQILDNLTGSESIFEPIESMLENQDYKDLMAMGASDPGMESGKSNFEQISTDSVAERIEMKSTLINSLTDLEWRLKIPVYQVDSKIVLLKSYLKSLLSYYEQLKDKKLEYDTATKNRVKALIRILQRKFRQIMNKTERRNLIKEALVTSDKFRLLLLQYNKKNSDFRRKAGQVVQYIRGLDLAISELKEKRFELEMSIVSRQMGERLDRVLSEAKSLNTETIVTDVDSKWSEKKKSEPTDVHVTSEAVADFLVTLGF